MEVYLGEPSKCYQFIKMFNLAIVGSGDSEKIERFKAFCGIDILQWIEDQEFDLWEELEDWIEKGCCEVLYLTKALNELIKSSQGEKRFLSTYFSKI